MMDIKSPKANTLADGLVERTSSSTLKSPKRKTVADGLIERTSSILDEIESKTVHKEEEGDQ